MTSIEFNHTNNQSLFFNKIENNFWYNKMALNLIHLERLISENYAFNKIGFSGKKLNPFDRNQLRQQVDYPIIQSKSIRKIDRLINYLSVLLIMLGLMIIMMATI